MGAIHSKTCTVALLEWYERTLADDLAHVTACPTLLGQDVVSIGERVQTRGECGPLFLGCGAKGLRGNRLHGCERVLDPMLDFVKQQLAETPSACLRSDMSRAIFEAPTITPSAFLIGDTVRDTCTCEPSLRWRMVS